MLLARATVLASRTATALDTRERAFDAAVAALQRAARLQPWDPDHAVNLGRVLSSAAAWAPDVETRQSLLGRAERAYARGLELRPGSVLFQVEHAGVLVLLGRDEAAAAELRSALALYLGYETGAMMLASLERGRAVAALRNGREEEATHHLEAALAALEGLLAEKGGDRTADRAVAALYARLGPGDEATAVLKGWSTAASPPRCTRCSRCCSSRAAGRSERSRRRRPRRAWPRIVRVPRARAMLELVRSRASRMPQMGEGSRP